MPTSPHAASRVRFLCHIEKCPQELVRLADEEPIRNEAFRRGNSAAKLVSQWPDDRAARQVFTNKFTWDGKDQVGLEKGAAWRDIEIRKR